MSTSSTKDGRRTSDIGIQVQVSNHFKRLLSKAMVVSVEESQNKSGEVRIGKTNETEPLLSHRKTFSDVKTMAICGDMGIVCKEPDYCVDGVRCAGGVIPI